MDFQDYYATLGVKRDASTKEIRGAFRKLAREHHPDLNPGNKEAEDRFKAINEANEVLTDPEKRSLYDQLGARWKEYQQYKAGGGTATPAEFARATAGAPTGAGTHGASRGRSGSAGAGGFSSSTMSEDDLRDMFGDESAYSDFFGDLFGRAGGATARGPRPGGDIEAEVQVGLEEAFTGTSVHLRLADPAGGERTLEATIPRGVRDGSRVRLAGQGNPGRGGGKPGDLYLVVTVRPHPRFTREGDNLHITIPVELTTCVLGGEIHVQTLKKTRLAVRVPAETQNGQVIRLRGQGMPVLRDPSRAGDLLVEVRVLLPKNLSGEERALFERLAALRAGHGTAGGTP
jgi:curved DNA-binding protein